MEKDGSIFHLLYYAARYLYISANLCWPHLLSFQQTISTNRQSNQNSVLRKPKRRICRKQINIHTSVKLNKHKHTHTLLLSFCGLRVRARVDSLLTKSPEIKRRISRKYNHHTFAHRLQRHRYVAALRRCVAIYIFRVIYWNRNTKCNAAMAALCVCGCQCGFSGACIETGAEGVARLARFVRAKR